MISIEEIFNSLSESSNDAYVGVNPMPEFNSKINESQKEIMDTIAPLYDTNERIRTLLSPFVEQSTGTSVGTIAKPTGFYRALGIIVTTSSGKRVPLYQAKENELIEVDFIPQRKADFSRGIAYYKQAGDDIRVIPSDSVEYDMEYIRYPENANLDYDYVEIDSGELALEPSGVVDLEWNENAFNLILYWMMRKYGIITRDQFILEIGNYGISADLLNRN